MLHSSSDLRFRTLLRSIATVDVNTVRFISCPLLPTNLVVTGRRPASAGAIPFSDVRAELAIAPVQKQSVLVAPPSLERRAESLTERGINQPHQGIPPTRERE